CCVLTACSCATKLSRGREIRLPGLQVDDDAVLRGRRLRTDIALDDVLGDEGDFARHRIAEAPAASRPKHEGVARAQPLRQQLGVRQFVIPDAVETHAERIAGGFPAFMQTPWATMSTLDRRAQ